MATIHIIIKWLPYEATSVPNSDNMKLWKIGHILDFSSDVRCSGDSLIHTTHIDNKYGFRIYKPCLRGSFMSQLNPKAKSKKRHLMYMVYQCSTEIVECRIQNHQPSMRINLVL